MNLKEAIERCQEYLDGKPWNAETEDNVLGKLLSATKHLPRDADAFSGGNMDPKTHGELFWQAAKNHLYNDNDLSHEERCNNAAAEYDKARVQLPDDVEALVSEAEARVNGLASGKAYNPSDPESVKSMREYHRRFADWQSHAPHDQRMLIAIIRAQGAELAAARDERDLLNAKSIELLAERDFAAQERDSFGKRIDELESEQAASWADFEKDALDALGPEVIGHIVDAGSDIPGMIRKLHERYRAEIQRGDAQRVKMAEQLETYKRIASIRNGATASQTRKRSSPE